MKIRSRRSLSLVVAVALFVACGDDGTSPEPGPRSLSILWPTADVALSDSFTFAVAVFTGGPENGPVTFTASLDGSRGITGVRQDSLVSFRLDVLEDGAHTLSVRSSTGLTAERTFTRELAPRPRIQAVSVRPEPGYADQLLTIRGERFGRNPGDVRVYLNGTALGVYKVWPDSIYALVPTDLQWAAGLVSVEVAGSSSPDWVPLHLYDEAAGPGQLWKVFPSRIPAGGAPVTILGRGFTPAAIPVFNGEPAAAVLRVGESSLPTVGDITELVVLAPHGAPSGPGELYVRENGSSSNAIPVTLP